METFYSNVFLGNFSFLCFSVPFNNKSQKVAPFRRNILSVLNISSFIRHTDKQTNKQIKRARVIGEGLTHTHTHTHTHTAFRYVTLMLSSQSLLHNPSDLFSFAFNLLLTLRSKSVSRSRQQHDTARRFIPCS